MQSFRTPHRLRQVFTRHTPKTTPQGRVEATRDCCRQERTPTHRASRAGRGDRGPWWRPYRTPLLWVVLRMSFALWDGAVFRPFTFWSGAAFHQLYGGQQPIDIFCKPQPKGGITQLPWVVLLYILPCGWCCFFGWCCFPPVGGSFTAFFGGAAFSSPLLMHLSNKN